MTCKECLHDKACADIFRFIGGKADYKTQNVEECCNNFADRSRFVELPCKPGDTVYEIEERPNDETCGNCPDYSEAFPGDPASCCKCGEYFRHVDCMTISETVAMLELILYWIKCKAWGESVFATREEAEAALAKRKDDEKCG